MDTKLELADLHNRNRNIRVVAEDCQRNGFPLIAWPEDKELLRLEDLPQFTGANQRSTWTRLEFRNYFVCSTNQELRDILVIGRAYAINPAPAQFNGSTVLEYKVVTK